MAKKDRQIEYALALNLNNFTKTAKLAVGQVKKMDKDIKRALKPTAKAFKDVGRSLAIGVAAGVAGSLLALNKLKSEMASAVGLATVQEAAEIRLAGVLRATGEAAGLSLDNLKEYASDLQDITAVGDETILANQAILASFKNIKGDQFKEATKAALDMSAAMDQDLKSSVLQIGKALNDPIAGLGALSRAGVTFTDQQKAMVTQLAKSGDVMGAQKIILKELESQFGGTAEALGNTFQKRLEGAIGAFNDLREEIGFTITKNAFFIQSADILKEFFKKLGASVKANAVEWRQWAKESALATLEFMADFGDVVVGIYSWMQKIAGAFKLAYAGALTLGKGFAYLFELSNKFFGDDEKAAHWAQVQEQAGHLIEGAFDDAAEAFNKADRGLPFVDKATKKIRQLKDDLAKIKPEFTDAADSINDDTGEVETETIKVGDTWVNVFKTAEEKSKKAADSIINDINRIKSAAKEINPASYAADGYATGGDPFHGGLGGYGGGDRRLIMVEDGEHVIRKEAVKRMGHGFFQRFNQLRFPGFATGGPVGAGVEGGIMTVNLNFGAGRLIPVRTSSSNARNLVRELERIAKRSS